PSRVWKSLLKLTALNADSEPIVGDFTGLGGNVTLNDFVSTTQIAKLNALSTLGVEFGSDHEITSTTLVLRSSNKDTRLEQGVNTEEDGVELLEENFEFIENQVWQTQLTGEHVFPSLFDLQVNWRGAFGRAFRDAPFQREILRARDSVDEGFALPFGPSFGIGSIGNSAVSVAFSEVDDQNVDLGIDFVLPFTAFGNEIDFKFGYNYTDKERVAFTREFIFAEGPGGFPDLFAVVRNDVLFSEAIAGTDAFDAQFITNPISLDNSESALDVQAGYVGLDAEVGPYFRVAVGARWEGSEQITTAFSTALPEATLSESVIDGDFLLPSVTLTWNPIGNAQLRFGYSETITRPQFRELTPAIFLDDSTDQDFIGNPFLRNSEIDNFDARLEYYLDRGQFITLGAFYKDITNPIETTTLQVGGLLGQTFVNAPSAELFGIEFEYEQTFDISDWTNIGFLKSADLVFKTNYTYSDSEVSADGDVVLATIVSGQPAAANVVPAEGVIVDGRRLQGQSDHLFNLQIALEDDSINGKAALLLNYASDRIRQTENLSGIPPAQIEAGLIPAPVIEQVPVLLDLVLSRDFETLGKTWNLELAARNLIGDDYEATQSFNDGTTGLFDTFEIGREFSAKATVKF
ncbi:MAG: TonB-dependent receptor, partial [Pseudomonadota bacterium]